ncbi:MAG: hypothetical protein U0800_05275 [Isosphaeraceae bacterium]
MLSAIATWMSAGTSGAQAAKDDPKGDPVAVLRAAGLIRSGNSFVLESELEANKLEKSVAQLRSKVIQGRRDQQEGQLMIAQAQELRAQAAELYRQAQMRKEESRTSRNRDEDEEKGRRTTRPDDGSTLRIKALSVEQDARQLEAQAQKRLDRKLDDQLNEYTRQIEEDEGRYQNLVDQTLEAYEQLYKHEDVVAAFRKLNHLSKRKVALGPIPQYVQSLARLCSDQLLDMGLTREKDLFSPSEEENLSRDITDFALRYRKAKKAGESDSGMKDEAGALRRRADEVEAATRKHAGDAVVRDLLAEVQKSQKPRIRVGMSVKLQRTLNDLKSIEKELASPAKK